MAEKNNLTGGLNGIIREIKEKKEFIFKDEEIADSFAKCIPNENIERLSILLPRRFWDAYLQGKLIDDPPTQSTLMTARGRNNGVVSLREHMASIVKKHYDAILDESLPKLEPFFAIGKLKDSFSLSDIPLAEQALLAERPLKKIENHDSLETIKKTILYLFYKKDFVSFFWWIFLFALFQNEITTLEDCLPDTQYQTIIKEWKHLPLNSPVCLNEKDFFSLRKTLVKTAKGEIFIAGSSLIDALSNNTSMANNEKSLIPELRYSIMRGYLKTINIFLLDPEMYSSDAPRRDINEAVLGLQENIYEHAKIYHCNINIVFLSLPQIDHAVITDEFMLFRSTKLWDKGRSFKGDYMLYPVEYYSSGQSVKEERVNEYTAHRGYLEEIARHSTRIYPAIDKPISEPVDGSALWYHARWRRHLEEKKYHHVSLYKVYEQQIISYANSTWCMEDVIGEIIPSNSSDIAIHSHEDFFNSDNLLGDDTQTILLPYIKETENLFNQAIEKHGHPGCKDGYCRIIPSLDLGFPNNVQRLAGGFATGMLVVWKCGVDIIPVDATVNVCTSSVFKLNAKHINPEWLDPNQGFLSFYSYVENLRKKASEKRGYSFAFLSGNHFLMLAREEKTGEYYLVLHSSANELKKSYLGLYPVENNWYSDKIKTVYNENKTRYFQYIKDVEARFFIQMAHNFRGYNEQIHQYIAEEFNGGEPLARKNDSCSRWMYHHYYMPTDQSICIGAFAERPGTQVPIFSSHGNPVYLFEIGHDNWTVNLGGDKGRVCVIPHGWGQEIVNIGDICIKNSVVPKGRSMVLHYADGTEDEPIDVKSSESVRSKNKHIRDFNEPEDFFMIGSHYMRGRIVKTLKPVLEYSRNTMQKK